MLPTLSVCSKDVNLSCFILQDTICIYLFCKQLFCLFAISYLNNSVASVSTLHLLCHTTILPAGISSRFDVNLISIRHQLVIFTSFSRQIKMKCPLLYVHQVTVICSVSHRFQLLIKCTLFMSVTIIIFFLCCLSILFIYTYYYFIHYKHNNGTHLHIISRISLSTAYSIVFIFFTHGIWGSKCGQQ